ncbi:MAG TPA: ABC transporter ATP-binding protein [Cytophagales bacterium]|nr:ABC transporter ATP-binding protein [Cytophagales bacterium]
MKAEKANTNILDIKVLKGIYQFVAPYRLTFYSLIILTTILSIVAVVRPLLIKLVLDKYLVQSKYDTFVWITILMFVVILFQALFEYAMAYYSGLLAQNVIKDIRIQLFSHILKFRLKFFDNTPVGRLITRTVSDLESVAEIFSEGLLAIAGDVLQIVILLGVMFYMDWKLTLISLSLLPILFYSTYVFKEKVKVSFAEVRVAVANLNTFVQEHITGMSIIQIFNAEKREQNKFEKINQAHTDANKRSILYYSVYFPIAEVISTACIALAVWYSGSQVLDGQLTLGTMLFFIMSINMFFRPIRMLADRFNTLQMGIVSADRVLSLIHDTSEVANDGDRKLEHVKGKVELKNVQFSYNPGDLVLKDISFKVAPGQTVALVGATGAGKSSIIGLINRFYDIQLGEILIDDVSLYSLDMESLRKQIGVVQQDVFLFSSSIYDNITLGDNSISKARVMEVARMVGVDELINRLPGGLDYKVMERGNTLSVGQRQLISFVRTMINNPKILILDEATSSVDSDTEELIQKAIATMMKGRTSIIIAHRLSTIKMADQIIVLEKGEIVEKGTHDELLSTGNYYAKLHEMQYSSAV